MVVFTVLNTSFFPPTQSSTLPKFSFKLVQSLVSVLKLAFSAPSEGTPVLPHREAPKIPFSEVDHTSDALYEAPRISLESALIIEWVFL